MVAFLRWWWAQVVLLAWRLYKSLAHKVTSKSRLERLCTNTKPSGPLTAIVEAEILSSRIEGMQAVQESLQSMRPFDVEHACRTVANSKGFGDQSQAVSVLRGCLDAMSQYNGECFRSPEETELTQIKSHVRQASSKSCANSSSRTRRRTPSTKLAFRSSGSS